MSPELKKFYKELQAWIEAGCHDNFIFSKRTAICSSLASFLETGNLDDDSVCSLENENAVLFKSAGLCTTYPFNPDAESFSSEHTQLSFYQNPKRLAWIKEHATD